MWRKNYTLNHQQLRKRNLWTVVKIISALEEYKKGEMTIGKMAKSLNAPKTTLHDLISGWIQYGTKLRPNPYLQADEEEALVDHLISAAKQDLGKKRKQVNMTVEMVAKSKGVLRKDKISNVRWRFAAWASTWSFYWHADSTMQLCMNSVNKGSISYFCDLLEST